MQNTPDIESERVRNDAFRRIGRNVYFFQLIEAALKHLVIHGQLEGNVSELRTVVERKKSRVARQPMGHLVDGYIEGIYKTDSAGREGPRERQEAWLSVAFKVEADPEFVRARKRALKLLVKERNDLIHRQLPDIRPDSAERWLELSAFLDLQRERLVAEFEVLRAMIHALAEAGDEALKQLDDALAAAHAGEASSQSS